MGKKLTLGILAVFVLICFLLAYYIKSAYKVLPEAPPPTMQVSQFEDWYPYTSPDNNFKITVPVLPQKVSQTLTDPKTHQTRNYDMYASETGDGSIYLVTLITYAEPISDPTQLLKETMNEMLAKNQANVLTNSQLKTYDHNETLFFTIRNETKTTQCKTFIRGQTLYLIAYIAPNKRYNEKTANFFLNSFELTSEKPLYTPFPPQP